MSNDLFRIIKEYIKNNDEIIFKLKDCYAYVELIINNDVYHVKFSKKRKNKSLETFISDEIKIQLHLNKFNTELSLSMDNNYFANFETIITGKKESENPRSYLRIIPSDPINIRI